jgi:hypothetical protein
MKTFAFRAVLLFAAFLLGVGGPASAATAPAPVRALVITYHVAPSNRAAFVSALDETARRMQELARAGDVASYRLLVNRFVDTSTWDAMLVVHFEDDARFERWKEIERRTPSALGPRALALVGSIDTVAADWVRHGGEAATSGREAVLAIPYEVTVPTREYLAYLDGYVLPQTEGWRDEGVLTSYGVYLARFPAGRAWQSMLVLAYRDDVALGGRDATVAKVRDRLKDDPAWKAISDNKKSVRNEKPPVLLDALDPR